MTNVQFKLEPVDYSKPYDEQPECKRHIIGAYANLARHNMTVTINVIMQAIGMDIFNENNIQNAFNKNHRKKIALIDNIQKVNLQKRLYRHFPFYKRMKLEDDKKKSVQLNTLLEVMDDFTSCMALLRNYYTHYHPYNSPEEQNNQLELKKKIGKRLQYLYENTCQIFKANESLDHESNEVLSALRIPEEYVEEFYPGDDEYDSLYKLLTDPQTKPFKKKGLKLEMRTQKITRKAVRYIRNPNYQAYMMDDKQGMSDTAIIYFLCLFLDKKTSFDLMDEIGFTEQIKFKGEHADKQLLYLKEIMCMNRIRMIKSKLDSEMSDTALALDMINELRKCPKPLYDVLCKEARDEFKDDATVVWEREHGQEAILTEDTLESDDEQETEENTDKNTPRSTFVRWDDRFPQMALKYIDMTMMFNDIRFHLNLGKYRFAFYSHSTESSVDGQERLRILQKDLHGFGRPTEVDEQKKLKWASLFEKKSVQDGLVIKEPDKVGQTPYITEQYSQYAIDEKSHSIGLRWEGWDTTGESDKHYGDLDKLKMFIPYIPSTPIKEEKQTNQAESLLAPQCTLSLYELPGLLFFQYLMTKYKDTHFDSETIIKQTYSYLNSFFTDVANGVLSPVKGIDEDARKVNLAQVLKENYHLGLSDIPDKLKKYLIGINLDNVERMKSSALNRLKERREKMVKALESFRKKCKIIGTKDNKFDKMRSTIKTGALGQTIARDIMEWLTDETKKIMNLTGQNYIAMQTAITLLGQKIDDNSNVIDCDKLKQIFLNANILSENYDDFDADLHHPFLLDVIDKNPDSVIEFYEFYLIEEIDYIDYITTYFSENKNKAGNAALYIPFLHANRARWNNPNAESIKQLAARYNERPTQLPSGLFAAPIFNIMMEIENPDLHKALEKAQNGEKNDQLSNNIFYLIHLYFKFVEHDHSQPYYNTSAIEDTPSPYLHIYRLFKKLYGEKISHSNRTTTPAYTIEQLKDLRKRAAEDINRYVDAEIQTWIDRQQFKFEIKTRKKLQKENDRRYKEHIKQLNIKDEINKAVNLEIDKMRHESTLKLEKQLKKVYDNERVIRRFKTQDILLLLMAREILKAKSQDQDFAKGFCLKYVMTDSFLDKPIDFSWEVNIRDKDKGTIRKRIEQRDMKMKNYGQFYKFASDHQRLESLFSRLPQSIFQRAEIENEFSYYDTNRSEVFRQVYIIESEAYKLKPELEDDKNANEDWFYYTDKKTNKRRPIRNSFIQLLEILAAGEDGVLDETEKSTLQKTRNAFGHNTYDIDLNVIFKGKKDKMKIPEIANGIKDKIEEQTSELKRKQDTTTCKG